jgi:hypothetical protein
MENRSPQERLWEAVRCLAVSAEPLQRRLANVAIALTPLQLDDFDNPDSREAFRVIMEKLTAVEPEGDEGSIEATTRRLSDVEAEAIAAQVVELDAAYRPLI